LPLQFASVATLTLLREADDEYARAAGLDGAVVSKIGELLTNSAH
jgi:hypothetical protein